MTWRARTAECLDPEGSPGFATRAVRVVLLGAIGVSVAAAALETLDGLTESARRAFAGIELATLALLALEYLGRLWIAPERHPAGADRPWRARLGYATSPPGLIDLLALVPALGYLAPLNADWLRVLRLLRLLKLARYAPALSLFAAVVRNESRALLATLLVVAILLVLESAVMFVLEREAQPKVFASIPHAMWWAIVTIATVGYGDMFPVTAAGKVFGGMVMVIGIALFAVPAGILATGFASEIRKRDFVVTWHTVARMPFFAGLEASRIAEIARLLKRQVVPAHFAVVRRGEPADAMFFIMAGQVEVDIQPHPVRLGAGQYFGEIALLRDTVRTATVTAVTECQLLSLDVGDFRRLLDAHPHLRTAVTRVAEERMAAARAGLTPPAPTPIAR
jgi:voltage-gated potassium channel